MKMKWWLQNITITKNGRINWKNKLLLKKLLNFHWQSNKIKNWKFQNQQQVQRRIMVNYNFKDISHNWGQWEITLIILNNRQLPEINCLRGAPLIDFRIWIIRGSNLKLLVSNIIYPITTPLHYINTKKTSTFGT